jgi:hypothetical protein
MKYPPLGDAPLRDSLACVGFTAVYPPTHLKASGACIAGGADSVNSLPPPPSGREWELDVEDAFSEHDIEYWVWRGNRLVPATTAQIVIIHEIEAARRLQAWAAREAQLAQARRRRERFAQVAVRLHIFPSHLIATQLTRLRSISSEEAGLSSNLTQDGMSSDHPASERSAL